MTLWKPTIKHEVQEGREVFYFAITDEMRRAGLFGSWLDWVGPYTDQPTAETQAQAHQEHALTILKETCD